MKTTRETINPDQIFQLEHEAIVAGDADMAAACRLAIYGSTEEIQEAALDDVIAAIQAAEAMDDRVKQ